MHLYPSTMEYCAETMVEKQVKKCPWTKAVKCTGEHLGYLDDTMGVCAQNRTVYHLDKWEDGNAELALLSSFHDGPTSRICEYAS